MWRKVLRSKIHRAVVTACEPDYVGSITVDPILLRAAGVQPNEAVLVSDIENGARLETYVIAGAPGSGTIALNGASARLVSPGDRVIIICFGYLDEAELDQHQARVVVCDQQNGIEQQLDYPSSLGEPAAVSL
jgi:aspartate 1-decarboxylase